MLCNRPRRIVATSFREDFCLLAGGVIEPEMSYMPIDPSIH